MNNVETYAYAVDALDDNFSGVNCDGEAERNKESTD